MGFSDVPIPATGKTLEKAVFRTFPTYNNCNVNWLCEHCEHYGDEEALIVLLKLQLWLWLAAGSPFAEARYCRGKKNMMLNIYEMQQFVILSRRTEQIGYKAISHKHVPYQDKTEYPALKCKLEDYDGKEEDSIYDIKGAQISIYHSIILPPIHFWNAYLFGIISLRHSDQDIRRADPFAEMAACGKNQTQNVLLTKKISGAKLFSP